MADAAAVRREARRRRILENSQNRLQKISGKTSEETLKDTSITTSLLDNVASEVPEDTFSFLSGLPNGTAGNEAESHALLSSLRDFVAAGDREVANDYAPLAAPAPEEVAKIPLWQTIVNYKYDIVLLSLLIQLLYSLSLFTFDNSYFFLPLIIYTVTKSIWFPVRSESKLVNMLMLLNGISASRIQNIMKAAQIGATVSQDVFVYLFTIICTQSLMTILNNNSVT